MRILLTGHEGYVGAGLLAYLRDAGHYVVGWGRRQDLFRLESETLTREGIEVLINCAVEMDREVAPYRLDSPTDRVNVAGARHLAAILPGTSICWFQISTREVFGPVYGPHNVSTQEKGYRPAFLVDDDQPFAPQSIYAKSKLMAEIISEGVPGSNVIRLCTCYTDLDHPRGNWMVKMIRAALTGQSVSLARQGLQFRDPLHTEDLGRLIESMLERGIRGEKVNAGGGPENLISVREFLDLVDPEAPTGNIEGGDYGFAFNNRRAHELTGWTPRVEFRERIPVMVENVRRALG